MEKEKMTGHLGQVLNEKSEDVTPVDEKRTAIRHRIGQRVTILRKQAGLTQEQLAERAGIQRTHVWRIETGKYAVTVEVLQSIAEALGMTVDIVDPRLEGMSKMKVLTNK